MRNLREGLIGLTVAAATLGGATIPSHATALFGLISWTSGTVVSVSTTTYPNPSPPPATLTITTRTVTVIIDPPPTFQDFDITVGYNPSMFQFLGGGTLCQFGVGGDCPAVDTTSGTIPIPSVSSLMLGAALPDSSLTLTDSGSSVQLSYDLSGVTS